jgi:hypothetical protein
MSETERKASFYERIGSFSDIGGCVFSALGIAVSLILGSGLWVAFSRPEIRPEIRYDIPYQQACGDKSIAVVRIRNEGGKGCQDVRADFMVSGTELVSWTKGDDVLSSDQLSEVERNKVAFSSNGIPAAETRTFLLEMADRGSIEVTGTYEWLDGVHSIVAAEPGRGMSLSLLPAVMIPWFVGTFMIVRSIAMALATRLKVELSAAENERNVDESLNGAESTVVVEPDRGMSSGLLLAVMIPWLVGTIVIVCGVIETFATGLKRALSAAQNKKSTET